MMGCGFWWGLKIVDFDVRYVWMDLWRIMVLSFGIYENEWKRGWGEVWDVEEFGGVLEGYWDCEWVVWYFVGVDGRGCWDCVWLWMWRNCVGVDGWIDEVIVWIVWEWLNVDCLKLWSYLLIYLMELNL